LHVLAQLSKIASVDATVLLTGETGTGKEVIARAIHYHSPRKGQPFVPVNCGALPDHLLENELFGHARGAFTDASSAEKGLLAEAEGGTLFLDEIDALSASAQVKLLRVLQDREYRQLGSTKSRSANVRIITATNTDLLRQVRAGRFREDLYYRLHLLCLRLPPLRERNMDIALLARHFLLQYGQRHGREELRLTPCAVQKLTAYPWPGNVRELEGVIQRAVVLCSAPILQPQDLELPTDVEQSAIPGNSSLRAAKSQMLGQFERGYLINLLTAHGGNVTQAAKQAGKERRAFQRLLRKHEVDRREYQ
jgi:DNA-binding NtrC family response regulator